ncbi:MAG: sugar phosphate isomerase/epimerase [Chloroflexota bacterium]|nr:MAG: sugar phosphate isomerase/epimerase [Chloroflexota bacterium]
MRLGLTNSTYQYLFGRANGLFPDRNSLEFNLLGQPTPYFTNSPITVPPGQVLEWLIQKCVTLRLPVLHAGIYDWSDPAYVAKIKGLLIKHKLEMMPALAGDFVDDGDSGRRAVEAAQETLRKYRAFGDIRISKFCTYPMIHTRFTTEPPLDEQLDRIIENTRPIARVAQECGIILAFENHLDYRAREVNRVIEAVNSPYFRFLFDTGNTLTVCEDPVDAAIEAAPYTVLVHLKDVKVHPWTPGREFVSVMYAAPLGRGHVNNKKILEILRDKTPNAKDLVLSLEMMPVPPNEDEDRWVDESIAYAKREFAEFLD